MPDIKAILKKMWDNLEEQKRNIDSFSKTQSATATDLYRTRYYAELIEKNLERLNDYLEEHKKINPRDRQEYARNLNNISIQTNIIKATQQAMNDQIDTLKKIEKIQTKICGKMVSLKKEIIRLLEKAEKIMSQRG
ncbi:MAG: hypothetical protein DRO96_03400 [Candidatus Aenigmatarchaeota archaeon]|nr:MAG: hypothetical protein DRO96_03400 [Candidatus Aenigmarchaeota archaeon]